MAAIAGGVYSDAAHRRRSMGLYTISGTGAIEANEWTRFVHLRIDVPPPAMQVILTGDPSMVMHVGWITPFGLDSMSDEGETHHYNLSRRFIGWEREVWVDPWGINLIINGFYYWINTGGLVSVQFDAG
jgi:hypothetical protein